MSSLSEVYDIEASMADVQRDIEYCITMDLFEHAMYDIFELHVLREEYLEAIYSMTEEDHENYCIIDRIYHDAIASSLNWRDNNA